MFDIHCHMLPGVDDGAQSLEEAHAMAVAAVADGVSHLVLTPHVYPGRFDNIRSTIEAEFHKFETFLQLRRVPLSLSFAGEVRLGAEVLELASRDEIPFLGHFDRYRTMLLELPDAQIPLGSLTLIRHLMDAAIRPVIVHPERNKAVMEKPERIGLFVDAGCFVQITAGSLLGQFGQRALAAADYMLAEGWVDAVASDAHNLAGRRTRMREAWVLLERRFDRETADMLLNSGPARLCGREVMVKEACDGA